MAASTSRAFADRVLRATIGVCGAVLVPIAYAQPATFLVGADDCDFVTIQPAIDAAAAHPGPDAIRIAMNATYDAQALRMNAQDVEIIGGFATCASAAPTPGARTTLSGTGGAADSVLVVLGSGVRILRNLIISGGDETDGGSGGGIDFQGTGELALESVIVSQNRAGFGGGISFEASPASATLTLVRDVVVQNNVAAGSGGGIRISGGARLLMLGPNTIITTNEALGTVADSGYGGGLQVMAPARAHIGSPGFGASGAIALNRAKFGGGIAVTARQEGNDDAYVLLYTTDPLRPVRVNGNTASAKGGGFYLSINEDATVEEETTLCAYEFRIDNNRAPDGAAIYLDTDDVLGVAEGAKALLNTPDGFPSGCQIMALPPAPDARFCAANVPCNVIEDNVVQQANGAPAVGPVLSLQKSATLRAQRVALLGNTGNDLILVRGNPDDAGFPHVRLRDCLIADNVVGARLLATDTATFHNCTIAGNTIGFDTTLLISDEATIYDSILWQPGKTILDPDRDLVVGGFNVASETASLLPMAGLITAPPRFVDAPRGDYRPRAASPAIDVAIAQPGDDRDLLNAPHDRDLPVVPNGSGPRDLGAYELLAVQPLVHNATFQGDLNQWTEVEPGVSFFDPAENVLGIPPSGALEIDWTESGVILQRVVARRQCVHLPGPGTYRLQGFARTTGSLPPTRIQTAALRWEFRDDGTEACDTGSPDSEGELNLTSGANWTSAANPAEIVVLPGTWTPNSSIAIYALMKASGQVASTSMRGWFDAISLSVDGGLPDPLFDDGFE